MNTNGTAMSSMHMICDEFVLLLGRFNADFTVVGAKPTRYSATEQESKTFEMSQILQ